MVLHLALGNVSLVSSFKNRDPVLVGYVINLAKVAACGRNPGYSRAHNLGTPPECLTAQHEIVAQHDFVAHHIKYVAQHDFVAQHSFMAEHHFLV